MTFKQLIARSILSVFWTGAACLALNIVGFTALVTFVVIAVGIGLLVATMCWAVDNS